MSKITTEQFLSHLGIEVEREFTWSGDCSTKYRISKSYVLELYSDIFQKWLKSASDIKDLLDEEITPLPKYTLTEDEKAIIRSIKDPRYKALRRTDDWGLVLLEKGGDRTSFMVFHEMFAFMDKGSEIPLDELRKCL